MKVKQHEEELIFPFAQTHLISHDPLYLHLCIQHNDTAHHNIPWSVPPSLPSPCLLVVSSPSPFLDHPPPSSQALPKDQQEHHHHYYKDDGNICSSTTNTSITRNISIHPHRFPSQVLASFPLFTLVWSKGCWRLAYSRIRPRYIYFLHPLPHTNMYTMTYTYHRHT